MKQFEIRAITGNDALNIQIYSPMDQSGNSQLTAQFDLPTAEGASSQIIGIQEGETVHVN